MKQNLALRGVALVTIVVGTAWDEWVRDGGRRERRRLQREMVHISVLTPS